MSVRVTAEATVNPTEDESKVRRVLLNIFPDAKLESTRKPEGVGVLRLHGEGLDFLSTFRSLIRQERIRLAARKIILGKTRGQRIMIYLHKQAAFVGRVSFCEPTGESPHGPVSIIINAANPETVIDYLASRPGQPGFQRFRDK
jgi:predicted RNA binding protein with dsRBD fold (UPF0201 family)